LSLFWVNRDFGSTAKTGEQLSFVSFVRRFNPAHGDFLSDISLEA
jgi:hypothetical protein